MTRLFFNIRPFEQRKLAQCHKMLTKAGSNFFLKKMGHPRPRFRLFSVFFKQTLLQFLQQINVKKCHFHPGFNPTTFGS